MRTYLLIPLIEVTFGLALIIALMVSGKRQTARRPFSLFLVFMTLWGVFLFMMLSTADTGIALLWEKLIFTSIIIASMLFYWFTVSFTGTRPKKNFLYPLLAACIVVLALIPTDLIVSDVQLMWYGKAPVIGTLFFLYVLCAYTPIAQSALLLIQHSRRTRIIDERVRDQYIIAGIITMLAGAATDYLSISGTSMYPLGTVGNILFCILATAAMLKHSLLEMRGLLRKGVTFLLTSLLVFGIFGSIIYLLSYFSRNFMSPISISLTMVAIFVAALITPPVFSRLQHTVDRWFFRERYDHIQTLERFTREIKADLNLKQMSSSLVNAAAKGMQSLGVYLLLPSPTTGNYTVFAYSGQKSRGRLHFSATNPLVVTMNQREKVIDNADLETIPSLVSLPSGDRQILENNKIELLVPIRSNGHLAGILLLSCKATHEPYSIEERRLLLKVSADVATSIDNANLYENIKREHSEMEKAMDGVVHALSVVVENRDPYTAGHQRRVAELARSIANKMGISEWQVMGIYVAGLLHDVGKVAVPAEILNKFGKINEDEYNIIKSHCQVGYDILQKIDFPWPVTVAILQHHERLDGSGYPAGVSGEEIILGARILGVADVVEAMSSHRPYRPALGLGSALGEISRNRGILYDPQVVDACLSLLGKNEMAFEQIMAAAESQESTLDIVMR